MEAADFLVQFLTEAADFLVQLLTEPTDVLLQFRAEAANFLMCPLAEAANFPADAAKFLVHCLAEAVVELDHHAFQTRQRLLAGAVVPLLRHRPADCSIVRAAASLAHIRRVRVKPIAESAYSRISKRSTLIH